MIFCLFMCCRNVCVVKEVSKDDVLLHLATNPVREGELPKDFILLVSKRVLLGGKQSIRSHVLFLTPWDKLKCSD